MHSVSRVAVGISTDSISSPSASARGAWRCRPPSGRCARLRRGEGERLRERLALASGRSVISSKEATPAALVEPAHHLPARYAGLPARREVLAESASASSGGGRPGPACRGRDHAAMLSSFPVQMRRRGRGAARAGLIPPVRAIPAAPRRVLDARGALSLPCASSRRTRGVRDASTSSTPRGARAAHGTADARADQDPAASRQTKDELLASWWSGRRTPAVRDPDDVLRAVREREEVLSTGIGNGVAIPHGKSRGRLARPRAGVTPEGGLRGARRQAGQPLLPAGRPGVGRGPARQGAEPHLAPAAARFVPRPADRGASPEEFYEIIAEAERREAVRCSRVGPAAALGCLLFFSAPATTSRSTSAGARQGGALRRLPRARLAAGPRARATGSPLGGAVALGVALRRGSTSSTRASSRPRAESPTGSPTRSACRRRGSSSTAGARARTAAPPAARARESSAP
jgi:hypothetical protein